MCAIESYMPSALDLSRYGNCMPKKMELHEQMKSIEVQTSPMLTSGAQLLPCGPEHVSGTKHYQICNND